MIEKVDHIGIMVKDLDSAMQKFTEAFDLKVSMVEEMDKLKLKLAFIQIGEVMIELLQPTGPGIYQDFISKNGEGIHHVCFKVTDINEALQKVGKVLKLRDKEPLPGSRGSKIAFLDTTSIFNVETELVEQKDSQNISELL